MTLYDSLKWLTSISPHLLQSVCIYTYIPLVAHAWGVFADVKQTVKHIVRIDNAIRMHISRYS